jgi:hypothetical protein
MTPLEDVNCGAAACALAAAVLWFLSARVEMPEEFPIALEISVSGLMDRPADAATVWSFRSWPWP